MDLLPSSDSVPPTPDDPADEIGERARPVAGDAGDADDPSPWSSVRHPQARTPPAASVTARTRRAAEWIGSTFGSGIGRPTINSASS